MHFVIFKDDANFAWLGGRHEIVRWPVELRSFPVMENRKKSRRLFRRRRFDLPHATIRDRALNSYRVHDAFYLMISRVGGTTRDLQRPIVTARRIPKTPAPSQFGHSRDCSRRSSYPRGIRRMLL